MEKYYEPGVFEVDLKDTRTVNLTPERLREIAFKHMVTSGPGLDREHMPTMQELTVMGDMLHDAVNNGRVICFGHWPNDMIKATSKHGGPLYTAGALAHPFSSPYVIIHSWDAPVMESGMGASGSSVYLVNPFPDSGDGVCIDFESSELEGFMQHGQACIGVMDRVVFHAEQSMSSKGYCVNVTPFAMRFMSQYHRPEVQEALEKLGNDLYEAAASNVLDPIVTALTILNTRNIPSQTVAVSDKLNKARIKSGKSPIPPYRKVDSSGYVTAILNRQERSSSPGGGHHASPVMHIRRGHIRTYANGERSFIRDTIVNATESMRKTFRSHYEVKE